MSVHTAGLLPFAVWFVWGLSLLALLPVLLLPRPRPADPEPGPRVTVTAGAAFTICELRTADRAG